MFSFNVAIESHPSLRALDSRRPEAPACVRACVCERERNTASCKFEEVQQFHINVMLVERKINFKMSEILIPATILVDAH